jgi:hypothetical protein
MHGFLSEVADIMRADVLGVSEATSVDAVVRPCSRTPL